MKLNFQYAHHSHKESIDQPIPTPDSALKAFDKFDWLNQVEEANRLQNCSPTLSVIFHEGEEFIWVSAYGHDGEIEFASECNFPGEVSAWFGFSKKQGTVNLNHGSLTKQQAREALSLFVVRDHAALKNCMHNQETDSFRAFKPHQYHSISSKHGAKLMCNWKKHLPIILLLSLSACTPSKQTVKDPVNVTLTSAGDISIDMSKSFNKTNVDKLFTLNGAGVTVKNFLFINESKEKFQKSFFGKINPKEQKLRTSSVHINDIALVTETYVYDFRFERGGNTMKLIDKTINHRSCGLVKVYSSLESSIQIVVGMVSDCAILTMSLDNYAEYKISNLLSELNQTAKTSFDLRRI